MSENRGAITKKEHQQKTALPKKTQLLCIGIDTYSNGIETLNNAVRDAQAFEKILKEKYGVINVLTLYDEAATLGAIIDTFDQLRHTITEADNLIIYFSGHGELINDRGYWIPVDAVAGERYTYLYNDEIRDLLFDLKAHHVLVVADACFSGTLLQKNKRITFKRYYAMPSRWVMTSGQIEVVPDGLPGHHSPFAKSLLTQLKHNPKAYLSLTELWVNMREGVVANSHQTPACEPVRDANHQGGEYYFIDKDAKTLPPIPENKLNKVGALKQVTASIAESTSTILKIPMKEFKRKLRKLQVTGKTKAAYELLMEKLDDDSTHMTTVYLRLADYNGLQNDIARGIAMNVPQRKAQINYALDYIIQNLEAEDLATD
ncbi:MAG: caspase family protein [Saprospiraceae bacterium]